MMLLLEPSIVRRRQAAGEMYDPPTGPKPEDEEEKPEAAFPILAHALAQKL
jgi:hypothetical protein